METCKEFFRNHKTAVIVTVGCVLLVVALLLCVSFLRGCESREGATSGVSEGSAEAPSAVSGGTSVAGSSADSGEGSASSVSIESGESIESGASGESGSPSESSEPGDEQSAGASSEPSLETSSKVPMVSEVEVSEPEQPAVSETPIDPPKPVDPPVEKQYKTAWGERPHEFEELPGAVQYGGGGFGSKIKQHSDGYGNTWYTYDGKILGNNSIFDTGLFSETTYAHYLGYGYWSNGLYYWSEDLPYTLNYNGMITANVPLKDHGVSYLPEDMPLGGDLHAFCSWFFEDGYAYLISECSDLDELIDLMNSIFEEEEGSGNHAERSGFEAINIHNYEDLITAIIDPFSYPFSPYTHEVKSA